MENKTAPHVRKHIEGARQTLYELQMAFDDGDRDLLLRLSKQLIIVAGHLANAVARYYWPARSRTPVDRSWGFFPPSAPPNVQDHSTHSAVWRIR